jgi:hypothetical protein
MMGVLASIASIFAPVREQIDGTREKIEALKQERRDVEAAPIPLAKAKQRLRQRIEEKGATWQPPIEHFAQPGDGASIDPDERYIRSPLAILCALQGDVVFKIMSERLAARHATMGPALDDAERARRLADIDERLYALEVEEESIITEATENGIALKRREDADVYAILGLQRRQGDENY